MLNINRPLVLVRGAGDIATGVIYRLVKSGFAVMALEIHNPSVIRRTVALAEAVTDGMAVVEGLRARLCEPTREAIESVLNYGEVAVVIDPKGDMAFAGFEQVALVDAILAKYNCGTRLDMAPVVVALGPGFEAGVDCHCVIETMRGHDLGRVLYSGSAIPNTGVPGEIAGHSIKRLIKSPCEGLVHNVVAIGDRVCEGDVVQLVGDQEVRTEIDGVVRGLIREGYPARRGLKIGDVDPRAKESHCHTISDKALAIGGGALQAVLEKNDLLMKLY